MRIKLVVAIGIALGLAGCILKDTRHTIYIDPRGAVVWTVLEEDVRSDTEAAADREREECEWLAAALSGDHNVARGLAFLGGDPETRVLRAERPFVVWTQASFESYDELARRLVDGLGLPGRLEVTASGEEAGVSWELDLATIDESTTVEEPLLSLLDGIENARLVLTEGRFVAAEGFVLDEAGRVARPVAPPSEQLEAKQGIVRWRLSWLPGPAAPAAAAEVSRPGALEAADEPERSGDGQHCRLPCETVPGPRS